MLEDVNLRDLKFEMSSKEIYEVEKLLGRRKVKAKVQYLVKWKGWPSDFNSWEDSKDISADLLRDYEREVHAEFYSNFAVVRKPINRRKSTNPTKLMS